PVVVLDALLVLPVVEQSHARQHRQLQAAADGPPVQLVDRPFNGDSAVDRQVGDRHPHPVRVGVESGADGHANTPAPARTRRRVNALSNEISDRTTRTTSPPTSMWFSITTEPWWVASTASPPRARIGAATPGGPCTTPPWWDCGSFGAPTVSPPIPGRAAG